MCRLASTILIPLVLLIGACDEEKPPKPVPYEPLKPKPLEAKRVEPLDVENAPQRTLKLGPSERFESCTEIAQKDERVISTLEWRESFQAWALACDAEVAQRGEDGRYYLAWMVSPNSANKDLRVAAWDKDGAYLWSFLLDRSREADGFLANFRKSFVTELGQKHVCAGTLYEGGTDAACVDWKTGEVEWSGRMPFWAGMAPQGVEGSLVVADLSGISERYPYSGAEMRHRALDASGGRSALYASNDSHLFFSPPRTEKPRLIKYDLKTFEPLWMVPLETDAAPGLGTVSSKHNLVIFKVDRDLVAMNTENGHEVWRLEVGEDRPSIAEFEDGVLVLNRHPERNNSLIAISGDGKLLWYAEVPAGILSVHTESSTILLRSVRASQRILEIAEDSE